MDWQDKRIHLSVSICQQYDQKHLWFYTQRMSNNNTPPFTDEEVLTIYLFGIMQQHTQIMAIDTYTKDHLFDWFPNLPTYAGYVRRLNRLCVVFTPWIGLTQKRTRSPPHPHIGGLYGETNAPGLLPVFA